MCQCGAEIISELIALLVKSFVFDRLYDHQIIFSLLLSLPLSSLSSLVCIDLSFVVLTPNRIQMHRHFHSMPSKLTLTTRKSIARFRQSESVKRHTMNTFSKMEKEQAARVNT